MKFRAILFVALSFATINAKVYEYYEYTDPKTGKQEVAVTKNEIPQAAVKNAKKIVKIAKNVLDTIVLLQKKDTEEQKKAVAIKLLSAVLDQEAIITSSTLIPTLVDWNIAKDYGKDYGKKDTLSNLESVLIGK